MLRGVLRNQCVQMIVSLSSIAVLSSTKSMSAQSGYCDSNRPACTQAIDSLNAMDAENAAVPGATTVDPNQVSGRLQCERYWQGAMRDLASLFTDSVNAYYAANKSKGITKQQAQWEEANRYFGLAFAKLQVIQHNCASRPYPKVVSPD